MTKKCMALQHDKKPCPNPAKFGNFCGKHNNMVLRGNQPATVDAASRPTPAAARRHATEPEADTADGRCIAVKASGERCTNPATFGSFCGTHNNMVLRGNQPATVQTNQPTRPAPANRHAAPQRSMSTVAAPSARHSDSYGAPSFVSGESDSGESSDDDCPCRFAAVRGSRLQPVPAPASPAQSSASSGSSQPSRVRWVRVPWF